MSEIRQHGEAHDSTVFMAGRDIHTWRALPDDAWETSPGRISIEPPLRPELPLRGRESLLDELVRLVTATGPVPRTRVRVLHGMGGCGKSSLAMELAHRATARGVTVWWLHAAGPALVGAGMRDVAERLGAGRAETERAWSGRVGAADLVWRLLNRTDRRWLLVFDNADEPEMLAGSEDRLAQGTGWLRPPATARGTVVVTSRSGDARAWGSWATLHPVSTLGTATGAAVVEDHIGAVEPDERPTLHALVERLGGLPLALEAAGSHIRFLRAGPRWRDGGDVRTLGAYLAALDARNRHASDASEASEASDGGNGTLDPETLNLRTVFDTVEMSLDLLARRGMPDARPLLRLLACMGDAPIPYAALLHPRIMGACGLFENPGEHRLRQLVKELQDLALVTGRTAVDLDDDTYAHLLSLHPLVRDACFVGTGEDERGEEFRRLMLRLVLDAARALDPDHPANWKSWHLLAPHCAVPVIDLLRRLERTRGVPGVVPGPDDTTAEEALHVVRRVSRYLLSIGVPQQAAAFIERARRAAGGVAPDNEAMLCVRHEFARCLLDQGRLPDAEAELRQVVEARTALLGDDHLDTLASRHKLARAVLEQRRWGAAVSELRLVLAGEESLRGPEHSDTLTVRHTLALAVLREGRVEEALRDLDDIIAVRRRLWDDSHPGTLTARQTRAQVLLDLGRAEEALAELHEVVARRHRLWDKAHPETLSARHTRAEALLRLGEHEAAVREFALLLEVRRAELGRDHPATRLTRDIVRSLRPFAPGTGPGGAGPGATPPAANGPDGNGAGGNGAGGNRAGGNGAGGNGAGGNGAS